MIQDIIDIGGHKIGTTETENGLSPEKLKELGEKMICTDCYNSLKLKPSLDVDRLTSRLGDILPTLSNFNLRMELSPIQAYAKANNIDGLKNYLGALVSYKVATADDVSKIMSLIKEQGIE